jgi:ribonuclease HI
MSYYVISSGQKIETFKKWEDCNKNIQGFANPCYIIFENMEDAKKILYDFTNTLYVYTDGACHGNGEKNAKAGIGIYFDKDNENNLSEKLEGENLTNNIAELTAAIKAIQIIKNMDYKNKVIVTDSEYVIKCATTYGSKLEKNKWLTSKQNKEPPNVNLIKKLYELTNIHNIKYKHIKAHTNAKDIHSISNYYADKLANESIGITRGGHCDTSAAAKTTTEEQRIYLNVPYKEKDNAKANGARWDANAKQWYIYPTNDKKDKLIATYK